MLLVVRFRVKNAKNCTYCAVVFVSKAMPLDLCHVCTSRLEKNSSIYKIPVYYIQTHTYRMNKRKYYIHAYYMH